MCCIKRHSICQTMERLALAIAIAAVMGASQPSSAQQQPSPHGANAVVATSGDQQLSEAQSPENTDKAQASAPQPAQGSGAQPSAPPRRRKRIAVVDFEVPADLLQSFVVSTGGGHQETYTVQVQTAASRLSAVVSDMLIKALVDKGNFDVIERMQIQRILKEKQIDNPTVGATAETGKLLGVDLILGGKLTEFGVRERKSGGAGGVIGIGGLLGYRESTARAVVDARLIEVATGRIVMTPKGEGENKEKGLAFGGAGGGGILNFIGAIASDSREWTDSRIGRATRAAVEQIVQQIVDAFPLEAVVLFILPDGSFIIDAGRYSNLVEGAEFEIFRETETRDEQGNVIWRARKKVGEGKAVEVQEERTKCVLTAPATEEKPQKGDIALLKKTQSVASKEKGKK